MQQARRRPDEEQRLRSVRALQHLADGPQQALDHVTRTTARLLDAPVALVTLVAAEQQHHLSRVGMADPTLPRSSAICDHVVAADEPLLVRDLQSDPRFTAHPLLQEGLHAYAGVPLHALDGQPVGSLCVLWSEPRALQADDLDTLHALAAWAERELRASEAVQHARVVQEAEQQLRDALDGAPTGVLVVDREGRVTWASRPAHRLFGLPARLPELGLQDLLPTFVLSDLARTGRRSSDGHAPAGRRFVQPGVQRDGVRFPAELTVSRLTDGTDRSVLFVRDLHDERDERVRLALLRARTEVVFDALEEGVLAVDGHGRVAFGNLALARMVHRRRLDLPGTPWHELLHGACLDPSCELGDVLALVGRRIGPLRLLRPDGTTLPVELSARLVQDGDEEGEAGVVMTVQDLTERLRVDRLKDEFLSAVSHELRTPLTSIRGSLGLLSSGAVAADGPQGARMLQIATESTERLSRLVNDLLDLERLRAGKVDLQLANHPVERLLTAAAHAVSGAATSAGVVVEVHAQDLSVVADEDRVVQVLTNLLGNAVKFSPEGSRVLLHAEQVDGWVRLLVNDHGRGIPPEDLERVFDRFAQVEAGDARRGSGTGLGLAIARGLAEQHGGRLTAVSREGAGSTFALELPAALASRRRLLYAPAAEVPRSTRQALEALGYDAVATTECRLVWTGDRPGGVVLADGVSRADRDLVRSAAAAAGLPVLVLSHLRQGDRLDNVDDLPDPVSGRVLVVEDDADLAEVLRSSLEDRGLSVRVVARPDDAVRVVQAEEPDAVVLDLVLEAGDGFEVADELQRRTPGTCPAVLVYTALELDDDERGRLQTGTTSFARKGEVLVADVVAQVLRLLTAATATDGGRR